jgi:hypothetical protein
MKENCQKKKFHRDGQNKQVERGEKMKNESSGDFNRNHLRALITSNRPGPKIISIISQDRTLSFSGHSCGQTAAR